MNILRNAGTHKILAIMNGLTGESPIQMIEMAGRTAYQSNKGNITADSAKKFVKMLIERGHESVLEHSAMTVRFDNCSRGFTHELVRHRLMAITQESTRYVDESDFNVVVPPHMYADDINEILCSLEEQERCYRSLRATKVPAQDARQVLPTAIVSQIVCTANFREWRHIFKLRTAKEAHWEIRRVMIQLLSEVRTCIPVVFDDIHPEFSMREGQDWDWSEDVIFNASSWCIVRS